MTPTSGQIFFEDKLPQGNEIAIKNLIGIVPQHLNFDQDLTVGENLELHARLYHLPKVERQKKIDELLHFVELEKLKNVGKLVALDTTKNLCNGKSLEDIFIQLTN